MDHDQITHTMDTNKLILEKTFAFVQTKKFLSEKVPWLEAKKKFPIDAEKFMKDSKKIAKSPPTI